MKKLIAFLFILILSIPLASLSGCKTRAASAGDYVYDHATYEYYSTYGALNTSVPNFETFAAIIETHRVANELGKPVKADPGWTYYIGAGAWNQTAIIQTDTYWDDAKFVIDDRNLVEVNQRLFRVTSKMPSIDDSLVGKALKKGDTNVGMTFEHDSLVSVVDNTKMRHRRGFNDSHPQREEILVDKNGNIDSGTPILSDYVVTSSTVRPIDTEQLVIKGGNFTRIRAEIQNRGYINRNILIERSNTLVDGICYEIQNNENPDSPYNGFLRIQNSAHVTVQNSANRAQNH